MDRRHLVAWIGGAAVLATAVVALRQTQAPTGPTAPPTTAVPAPSNHLMRFAVEGVLLPEPGGPPAMPAELVAVPAGPDRLRVAWGSALPDGSDPADAVGYDVRWRAADGSPEQQRLVAVPELQLDGLTGEHYVIEVRSVDAFGRRSEPARTHARPGNAQVFMPGHPWTALFEDFSGEFSVDTAGRGNRWHFAGHQGCTRASMGTGQHTGQLAIDFECGGDLTVLRYRSPVRLAAAPGERGRVAVVTDAAGPRGLLTIDLVPEPVDQVGAGRDGVPPPVKPPNGTAGTDATLPAGAIRVLVNDDGARVLTGQGVARTTDPPAPPRAPTRGPGVLHTFEVVQDAAGVQVLQDGIPIAVAGIAPTWSQAHLLIGLSGPPGRRSRIHVDAVGLSGQPVPLPPTFVHPVVAATQRVLGPTEDAPGIGISGEQVRQAASARLLATVTLVPGVDLSAATVQYGAETLPARPVLPLPTRTGSLVTVAADLPARLLGPAAPPSVSPLVLRAPGADDALMPIVASYLEIVPLADATLTFPAAPSRAERSPVPDSLPVPTMRLLDSEENLTTTVAPGARLLIDIDLDQVGSQLESGSLAGVAGFELWMDNRRIAVLPTAIDGPGVGGQYSLVVPTRRLQPGPHFLELRVIPTLPAKRASRLASFTVATR